METVLVIGLGEIGRALFEIIAESNTFDVYGLDIDNKKMQALDQNQKNIPSSIDIMHICIPFINFQHPVFLVSRFSNRLGGDFIFLFSVRFRYFSVFPRVESSSDPPHSCDQAFPRGPSSGRDAMPYGHRKVATPLGKPTPAFVFSSFHSFWLASCM